MPVSYEQGTAGRMGSSQTIYSPIKHYPVTNVADKKFDKKSVASLNELSGLRKKIVNYIFELSFRNLTGSVKLIV